MGMTQDKDQRAAFEAAYIAASSLRLEDIELEYDDAQGRYHDDQAQSTWEGWQMGVAHDRQKRDPSTDYEALYEQMCNRCDDLDAKLAEYEQRGEPVSEEITLRVYHKTDEHREYLSARFYPSTGRPRISFEWKGHRWAYRYTHFDDRGDYDLIYRPAPQPAEPVAKQPLTSDDPIACCADLRPDCMGMLVEGIGNRCAALSQPTIKESLTVAEPWSGHKFQEHADGTWRCADGCGPVLIAKPVTHFPDGTPRDSRDIASDPDGTLIHNPAEPLRPAEPVKGEPSDAWRMIEKYADAVTQYNEAVRIDVGIDKAGADCLAIEKQLRALLARYQGAQPVAPDWSTINTLISERFADDPGNAARCQSVVTNVLAHIGAQPAASAEPYGWIYDWTHSSATGKPDEHITSFGKNKALIEANAHNRNIRAIYLAPVAAQPATYASQEPCKMCGGSGWYTSHTTGYPHDVPCCHCNPDGASKPTTTQESKNGRA